MQQLPEYMTTTMVKEELATQMGILNEEVKLQKQQIERDQMDQQLAYMTKAAEEELRMRNEMLARLNNKPFENHLKFREDQKASTTLDMHILEKRGGLLNNPPKPKPVKESPMTNLWDKKSHNSKYNASLPKSKINKGCLNNLRK